MVPRFKDSDNVGAVQMVEVDCTGKLLIVDGLVRSLLVLSD